MVAYSTTVAWLVAAARLQLPRWSASAPPAPTPAPPPSAGAGGSRRRGRGWTPPPPAPPRDACARPAPPRDLGTRGRHSPDSSAARRRIVPDSRCATPRRGVPCRTVRRRCAVVARLRPQLAGPEVEHAEVNRIRLAAAQLGNLQLVGDGLPVPPRPSGRRGWRGRAGPPGVSPRAAPSPASCTPGDSCASMPSKSFRAARLIAMSSIDSTTQNRLLAASARFMISRKAPSARSGSPLSRSISPSRSR